MAKVLLVLEDSSEGLSMDLVSDPVLPSDLEPEVELTAAQFMGLKAHQYLEEVIGTLSKCHKDCSCEESSLIIGADNKKTN